MTKRINPTISICTVSHLVDYPCTNEIRGRDRMSVESMLKITLEILFKNRQIHYPRINSRRIGASISFNNNIKIIIPPHLSLPSVPVVFFRNPFVFLLMLK